MPLPASTAFLPADPTYTLPYSGTIGGNTQGAYPFGQTVVPTSGTPMTPPVGTEVPSVGFPSQINWTKVLVPLAVLVIAIWFIRKG